MMLYPALENTSVYTVSQLNNQIKKLLESNYPYIWVKGEISNFRVPASGHFYFSLKDEQSQIRAVFFRPQQRHLRFAPEDGLEVLCQGRLSVYEPRGEYQLIVEIMEPKGLGALQLAFEQLKKKLAAEGLFDFASKLPLPPHPQRIAIITSSTGAAIRDILKVFQRAPYPITATLLPVRVQGEQAAGEIAAAIATINTLAERCHWDVMIVGRGGGSLEDLWAFNEEIVARAIAASQVPIISAVGHEIDLTISDLVADLRAPTPTAAAEWIVTQLERTQREIDACYEQIRLAITQKIQAQRQEFEFLKRRLADPRKRLADLRLFVDDRSDRLQMAFLNHFKNLQIRFIHLNDKLYIHHPLKNIQLRRPLLERLAKELALHHQKILDKCHYELRRYASQLETLSPLGVLARGYSITYLLPEKEIVRRSSDVQIGRSLRIRLAEGALKCIIHQIE